MDPMNPTSTKCLCTVCSGHIAFDAGNSGETVTCPHCGMDTVLYLPRPTTIPEPPPIPQTPSDHPKTPIPAKGDYYCQVCGSVGKPKKFTPGSLLLEIVLWLLIIVPGVIYSFWRLSSRRKVCSVCRSPNIIPATSPNALRALAHTPLALFCVLCAISGLAQTGSPEEQYFYMSHGITPPHLRTNTRPGVALKPLQARPTTPPKAEYRTITNQLFNVTLSQAFVPVRGRCAETFPGGIVVAKDRKEAVITERHVNPPQLAGSIGGTPLQKTSYVTVGTDYKVVLHAPATVAGADVAVKAVRIGATNYLDHTVPLYDCGIPAQR